MIYTDGLKTTISNVDYLVNKAIKKGSANKEDLAQLGANIEEVYSAVERLEKDLSNADTTPQMLNRIKDRALKSLIRFLKKGLS